MKHKIDGVESEVQFVNRPGTAMWEPMQILRGVNLPLKKDCVIVVTDHEGHQRQISRVALVEDSTGKGKLNLLQGQFLVGEWVLPSYTDLLNFLKALGEVATDAMKVPGKEPSDAPQL